MRPIKTKKGRSTMCERPNKIYIWNEDKTYRILSQHKCKTCSQCKGQYISGIQFRLALQFRQKNEFPPQKWDLTFTDDALPEDNKPNVKHHQQFLARMRAQMQRRGYKGKITYFVIHENAPVTNRLHYHIIIFNLPYRPTLKEQKQFWPHGRSRAVKVNNPKATWKYHTKYILKSQFQPLAYKPMIKYSLRPMLGEHAIMEIINHHIQEDTIPDTVDARFRLWTRPDDPSSMQMFYCPKWYRDLQIKHYTAAGASYPEYSAIASELKNHKELVQPDPEAVRKASTATRKREAKLDDMRQRINYRNFHKSWKTLIQDQHDLLNLTKDIPDEKANFKRRK